MRLLLTSGGIRNDSMRTALAQLVGQPWRATKLVFVVTAAVAQAGDHDWLVADLNRVHGLGWGTFNMLEINGLPRAMVLERLADADVIYVEGGNAYHLARSIADTNLEDEFLRLLEHRVYVGVSAGSMLFTRNLTERLTGLFGAGDELYQLTGRQPISPFNLFDWYVQPHVDLTPGTRLPPPSWAVPCTPSTTNPRSGSSTDTWMSSPRAPGSWLMEANRLVEASPTCRHRTYWSGFQSQMEAELESVTKTVSSGNPNR